MKGKENLEDQEGREMVGRSKCLGGITRGGNKRRRKEGISQSGWHLLISLKEGKEELTHQELQ